MKRFLPIIAFLIILFFVFTCNSKDNEQIEGIPITDTSCNLYKSNPDSLSVPSDQSCINYSYDEVSKKLTFIHKNAAFNCCPGTIYYNPTANDSLISIREFETEGLCDCSCLYDLNMTISNVEARHYLVKFIEPYRGGQEELVFDVDLINFPTGVYCVSRYNYPWGINK